jgi:glycine hydroxymethyltransferase
MQHWGAAYTGQVTANAQALGAALAQKGIGCVNVDGLYTRSHTILACVSRFGKGAEMAARLEACGIITTAAHLPEYWGVEGLRLGTQEVTRLGAKADDMQQIAGLIEQALSQARNPEAINADAAAFAAGLGPVHFTWTDETL